jgi:hypothetical protein
LWRELWKRNNEKQGKKMQYIKETSKQEITRNKLKVQPGTQRERGEP